MNYGGFEVLGMRSGKGGGLGLVHQRKRTQKIEKWDRNSFFHPFKKAKGVMTVSRQMNYGHPWLADTF